MISTFAVAGCVALLSVPATWAGDSTRVAAAYQRPGTHHASIGLSVVDPTGEPLAGAGVSLIVESAHFRGRFELARAETSLDGRVLFQDVSSSEALALSIDHGPAWRQRYQRLRLASFGHCELGELTLLPNQVLTGAVALPLDWGMDRTTNVGIQLIASDGRRLAGTAAKDGWYRLEGYDLVPAKLVVTSRSQRQNQAWEAHVPADEAALDRRIDIALTSPRGQGPFLLETEELAGRPRVPAELEEVRGRITMPDGSPASGLIVELTGHFRPSLGRTATDDDGRFTIQSESPIEALRTRGPFGALTVRERPVERPDRWWSIQAVPTLQDIELQLSNIPDTPPVALDAEGLGVALSWLRDGAWEPCSLELAALVPHQRCIPEALRASIPGHASRLLKLRTASVSALSFEDDVEHALTLTGPAGPIPNARVELAVVRPPRQEFQEPEYTTIEGLSTDDRGHVSLLADPDEVYLAFIDAHDHDPACIVLTPGASSVRLARREHEIRIEADQDGWVRLLRAGTDQLVAMEWAVAGQALQRRVAPGSYDVTLQQPSGAVVRQQTFQVSAGSTEPLAVDLSVDRRPRIVLGLPELPPVPKDQRSYYSDLPGDPAQDHWEVRVARDSDLFAVDRVPHPARNQPDPEPQVTIEQRSEVEFALTFPAAGRWQVHIASQRGALDFRLFREVNLATGDRLRLEIPALESGLRGSMRMFDADLDELSYHGYGGPRLCLLNASGADRGWSVLCYTPPRVGPDSGGRFSLPHLPVGRYLAFDHLSLDEAGWGGSAIELGAGQATTIADFADHPIGAIRIDVVDPAGEPLRNATLHIRDRCYESWRDAASQPGDRSFATHHLPAPANYRLSGASVLVEGVRAGWLELEVDVRAGVTHRFLESFELGETVTLTLPE